MIICRWGGKGRAVLCAVLNETFPREYSKPGSPTLSPSGELSLDLFYEMVLVRELGELVGMVEFGKSREEVRQRFAETREFGRHMITEDVLS